MKMDDDVQHLVLAPFYDVAAKGKVAVGNAKAAGSPSMLKAAQSLLNNGERALKKIEPVCRRQLEECGVNFVDALKENGGYSRPELVSDLTAFRRDFQLSRAAQRLVVGLG